MATMMATDDTPIRIEIGRLLAHVGYRVEHLAERSVPTPDLLAVDSTTGDGLLIEIKSRFDDSDWLGLAAQSFAQGQAVAKSTSFSPDERVRDKVSDAAKQLASWESAQSTVRVIWLVALGRVDAGAQFEQFESSLYGTAGVVGDDALPRMLCYYFGHSGFHRHRDQVDGAVISTQKQHRLCINTYSSRADAVRAGLLAQSFGTAIRDPETEERQGRAYIADCETDRKDEAAVVAYLEQKYHRGALCRMDLGSLTIVAKTPAADPGQPAPQPGVIGAEPGSEHPSS